MEYHTARYSRPLEICCSYRNTDVPPVQLSGLRDGDAVQSHRMQNGSY